MQLLCFDSLNNTEGCIGHGLYEIQIMEFCIIDTDDVNILHLQITIFY